MITEFNAPFIIFSDFEAILPTTTRVSKSIKPSTQTNMHTHCGFGIYLVSFSFSLIIMNQSFQCPAAGDDCMDVFYNELFKLSNRVRIRKIPLMVLV